MRIALSLGAACLLLTACSGYDPYLPDGGRARVNCTGGAVVVPVKVLDPFGDPSEGAIVRATNNQDGRYQEGATDNRGVFLVTDELAPGAVAISGELNGLKTQVQDVTFTCGECSCAASPRDIYLNLK